MNEKFKPTEKSKSSEDLAFEEYDLELSRQHDLQNKVDALDEALAMLADKPRVDPAVLKLMTDRERTVEEWQKQSRKTKEAGRKLGKILQKAADEEHAQEKLGKEQWEELKRIMKTDEDE